MRFSYRAMIGLALLALLLSACDTISGAKVDELETKNAQYQATIDAIGTPLLTVIALEQYATQNVVLQARLNQAENESLAARATLTMYELGGAGGLQNTPAAPNVAAVPSGAQIQPQETPGAGGGSAVAGGAAVTPTPGTGAAGNGLTQFSQTVTATDLDSSDCPVGVTSTFNPSEDTIYVNTQIDYLPAGSQLSAKWTVNGEVYLDDPQCWVPNQDYFDICAYCTVAPNGGVFTAGDWTVELLLDGQSMAQTSFQVMDPNAADTTGSDTSAEGNN